MEIVGVHDVWRQSLQGGEDSHPARRVADWEWPGGVGVQAGRGAAAQGSWHAVGRRRSRGGVSSPGFVCERDWTVGRLLESKLAVSDLQT